MAAGTGPDGAALEADILEGLTAPDLPSRSKQRDNQRDDMPKRTTKGGRQIKSQGNRDRHLSLSTMVLSSKINKQVI